MPEECRKTRKPTYMLIYVFSTLLEGKFSSNYEKAIHLKINQKETFTNRKASFRLLAFLLFLASFWLVFPLSP